MNSPLPLISLPLPRLPDLRDLSPVPWLAVLGVGLVVGLPMSADADSPDPDEDRARPAWTRWLDPNAERPPIGSNLYYKKGSGFEYRRAAKFGESPIEVGVQGPMLRKKKDPSGFAGPSRSTKSGRGVGLSVEIRF
jgi:hypothetical protein